MVVLERRDTGLISLLTLISICWLGFEFAGIMANLAKDFIASPSDELLDQCSKEQLIIIAQHFSVEVDQRRTKETLKGIIRANLCESGVLLDTEDRALGTKKASLTFEQQKELLLLKLEHEKEMERIKY